MLNAPRLVVGMAAAASAALLLVLGAEVSFMFDEWELLLHREGFGAETLLEPLNEHIFILPAGVYAVLRAAFGLESGLGYDVVAVALLLASAALLFLYVRRRLGDWPAALATVLVLFLGAAWEVLIWPLTLSFSGSIAAGIAMLLALERGDRRGDALACGALCVSIAFMSLGLLFALAAATVVLLDRERRRRLYVFAVPLLLYALWYLGWGREGETNLSLDNVIAAPGFMLEGIASSCAALLGLFALQPHVGTAARVAGAVAVAVAGAALLAWLVRTGRLRLRLGGRSPFLWAAAVLFFGFWALTALNDVPWRTPSQSRYMYAGGVLLVLLLAEVFRGQRMDRRAGTVAVSVLGLALVGNLVALRDGYRVMRDQSELVRAQLAALELAREHAPADFAPVSVPGATPALFNVTADAYFGAVDEHGSPAYEAQELPDRSERARATADLVLAAALGLELRAPPATVCIRDAAPAGTLSAPPGTAVLVDGGGVALRRFAREAHPVTLEVAGERARRLLLELPPDGVAVPWHLEAIEGRLTDCGQAGSP